MLKITLPRSLPPVLGVGAYLKNALCLIQGEEAWMSPEVGSLDSREALRRFDQTAQEMLMLAQEKPLLVAHDWHPDFYCTRWAMQSGIKTIGIQHHHAHIAAIMAEHGIEEPVLGLALDGFGLGENNEAWGGELLRVDASGFIRLGHLRPLLQAGGDKAAREPWRMGAAALFAMGRADEIETRYAAQTGAAHVAQMMERGLNAPPTTSAGRLFDAACGLLNIMPVASFEGEAPMKLESLVTQPQVDPAGWRVVQDSSSRGLLAARGDPALERDGTETGLLRHFVPRNDDLVLDLLPLLERLAVPLEPREGANLFHSTLAAALLDWVTQAREQTGLSRVAMGGGCFLNKVLRLELERLLRDNGFEPLWPQQLSVGDTALALGQAYAAALHHEVSA